MKIQKVSHCLSLLLLMVMLTGCGLPAENVATTSSSVPVTTTSATEMLQSTLTPTATSTPTPSSTHTAVPTLPVEDARQRLLELLANNGGCQLPCLWGITPGISTNVEARNILMPLSSIAAPETTYFGLLHGIPVGAITSLYVENELRLNAGIGYDVFDDGDTVRSIGFRVREEKMVTDSYGNLYGEPVFDFPPFAKRVEYYSLSHVLSKQGIPDSVMISFYLPSDNPSFAGGFEIALLYPEKGIWVHYTMPLYSLAGTQRGCPASAHVEMDLYPSGNPEAFYLLLEETDWARMKHGYKSVEEATSLSVEEFYQTFRNPTDKCIETPENLWLTPEP